MEDLIKKDISQEQIVGYCKKNQIECVSHERIYQFIWADKKQKKDLFKHLRNQGKRYLKRGNTNDSRGILSDRNLLRIDVKL